jgi:hypothetical protein
MVKGIFVLSTLEIVTWRELKPLCIIQSAAIRYLFLVLPDFSNATMQDSIAHMQMRNCQTEHSQNPNNSLFMLQ